MQRKFVTNLALVISLNLLVKPFWVFGIDRTVQNIVGAETYGFYFSLFSYSLLLNILLDVGITNFNNRSIARVPARLSRFLSNIIVLKFLLAIVYAFVCLGGGLLIGYDSGQFKLLAVLIINQFLASFVLYLRSNISALHYFRTDSIISVLDRSLAIIICAVLLWGKLIDGPFQIEWFVYAQTAAYLLTAAVTLVIIRSKAEYIRLGFETREIKTILQQSYPYALLVLFMSFYYRIDSVMLERLLENGKQQAGIYAQSFRILDAAGMFAFLFAGLLLPIFSGMIKRKEPVREMIRLSYTLIFIPALVLAVLSLFYPLEILDWLYHDHLDQSSRIFPVLMFGFIAISTTYIFGTLLTANGNLKVLNLVASSTVVLNIILNLILIPRHQAYGAAISSLITQSCMALAQLLISVKKLKLSVNLAYLSKVLLYTVIVFAAGAACRNLIASWYAGALIYLLTVGTIAFIIRLLNLKFLVSLFTYHEQQEYRG